jgi:hypothetical protein
MCKFRQNCTPMMNWFKSIFIVVINKRLRHLRNLTYACEMWKKRVQMKNEKISVSASCHMRSYWKRFFSFLYVYVTQTRTHTSFAIHVCLRCALLQWQKMALIKIFRLRKKSETQRLANKKKFKRNAWKNAKLLQLINPKIFLIHNL